MAGSWQPRGYTVEQLLGRGGSGEVWRARVAGSGEPVALKRIPLGVGEPRAHAHAEAALLAALDHPHLVRLHAMFDEDDAAVLVLDLADGGSLAELLTARGRLALGEVITAVAPVAAALAHLHDAGVTHGDVSAANILFDRAGSAMLADVGVARLAGDAAQVRTTPAYVDPVVAAGAVPGPRSDVFMLAGVALHALTGAPTWPGPPDEALASAARAARGADDELRDRLGDAQLDPAAAAVLRRALSVEPARRGSAADLALDLRASGEPVAVELAAGARRPVPSQVRDGPRHAAPVAQHPVRRRGAAADPAAGAAGQGSPGRPAFDRPALLASGAVAPPTRLVGVRPRPQLPGRRSRLPCRRSAARAALAVLAVLVVVAVGLGGLAWARAGGGHDAPPPGASTAPAADARPTAWAAVLDRLDRIRSRAFAERRPALLAQVYGAGPLLDQDSALLRRLVPSGCGLQGVHTSFSAVRAARAGPHAAVLVADATLTPSRLVCGGRQRGTAAGAGPVRRRIEVQLTRDGARVVDERAA